MPLLAHCCSQSFATDNYLSFPIVTMGSVSTKRTNTPNRDGKNLSYPECWVPSRTWGSLTAVAWTRLAILCSAMCTKPEVHSFSLFNLSCISFFCFSSRRSRSTLRRWRRCSRPWCSCRQRVRNGSSWSTGCGRGWRGSWNLSACSRYPPVPWATLGFL